MNKGLFGFPQKGPSPGIDGRSLAKAWVYFDGSGIIKSAYNIKSVTVLASGHFEVTFLQPLPVANYAIDLSVQHTDTSLNAVIDHSTPPTTNRFRIKVGPASAAYLQGADTRATVFTDL